MSGNRNQYDPAEMFKEWIQKSGKAQSEFMKNFSLMMSPQTKQFDPLETLKEISSQTADAQSNLMQNLGSIQSKGMDKMFNMAQMMPNFLSWGGLQNICWFLLPLIGNGRN